MTRKTLLSFPERKLAQNQDNFSIKKNVEKEFQSKKKENLKVGNSEIWRFYIKTDSLTELRPHITTTLSKLELETAQDLLTGKEAPGGIQYNLLVPKNAVLKIKSQIEKASDYRSNDGSQLTHNFTWYKNKSRKTIPKGHSRVIIWLSQI